MESVLLGDSNSAQTVMQGAEDSGEGELSDDERLSYAVFSEKFADRIAYGISVTDAWGKTLQTVHDITCDRDSLEGLVNLCNRLGLALCHLEDVIEDFLG